MEDILKLVVKRQITRRSLHLRPESVTVYV